MTTKRDFYFSGLEKGILMGLRRAMSAVEEVEDEVPELGQTCSTMLADLIDQCRQQPEEKENG